MVVANVKKNRLHLLLCHNFCGLASKNFKSNNENTFSKPLGMIIRRNLVTCAEILIFLI